MTDFIRKKKQPCPSCGYEMDAATELGSENKNSAPNPGDFALCLSCGEILRFDDKLKFRTATQKDLEDLDPENYKKALHASLHIKKHQPLKNKNYGR